MSVDHRRLRMVEAHLRKLGATAEIPDDEIDLLTDEDARRIALAEGERLDRILELEAEGRRRGPRGAPPPTQGRLWD